MLVPIVFSNYFDKFTISSTKLSILDNQKHTLIPNFFADDIAYIAHSKKRTLFTFFWTRIISTFEYKQGRSQTFQNEGAARGLGGGLTKAQNGSPP